MMGIKDDVNNAGEVEVLPVLWFKLLPGLLAKANGQCYDVVFAEMPGHQPLYADYRMAHFGKALVESVVIESDHPNCHVNGQKQEEQIDALKSDLTKALELLRHIDSDMPTSFKDAWKAEVQQFLAHQSSPAAKTK